MHPLPQLRHANLDFVTPRLAIGGDLHHMALRAACQMNDIDKAGITHIVDCRIEWSDEKRFAQQLPEIAYLWHGMDDAGQEVPPAWFDTAISWIDEAGDEAIVLTHCHMGINRGPSLGFAVLLHWGWDPIDAMTAIRDARPRANTWYAGGALRWFHGRRGTDPREDLVRLEAWLLAHPLDVVRLIRQASVSD